MTLQLFRPVDPPEGCRCYGVVIDDGDGAFEYIDSAGTVHDDVGAFNIDTTPHAEWVECVPRPALERAAATVLSRRDGRTNPDDRRGVVGADGERIGEVWLDGNEWRARYGKIKVAGFDENPPTFGRRDAAIAWVLEQDRDRIAKLHAAAKK